MALSFRPLHDNLFAKRVKSDTKAGSLYIPDAAQEKPQEAEVFAVGKGRRDDQGKVVKPTVKVGDRILFGKWSGTETRIDGDDYLILTEREVLAVL